MQSPGVIRKLLTSCDYCLCVEAISDIKFSSLEISGVVSDFLLGL